MRSALDVAAYIVSLSTQIGEPVTNMKLQKLLYYSLAWYAVETKGKKLFSDPIVAWKYGPVIVGIYEKYKKYGADAIKAPVDGKVSELNALEKEIVEDIFNIYGSKSAIELMSLSHSEQPWRDTFDPDDQQKEIPFDLIMSYFSKKKQLENAI